MEIESLKLEFYLRTRVLDTRDANFQHCFETWQLTKFFNIYCYLEKKFYTLLFTLLHTRILCSSLSSIHVSFFSLYVLIFVFLLQLSLSSSLFLSLSLTHSLSLSLSLSHTHRDRLKWVRFVWHLFFYHSDLISFKIVIWVCILIVMSLDRDVCERKYLEWLSGGRKEKKFAFIHERLFFKVFTPFVNSLIYQFPNQTQCSFVKQMPNANLQFLYIHPLSLTNFLLF